MWCAFADTSCPSHQRWGEAAGDGLARSCVEDAVDGGVDAAVVDAGIDADLTDARPGPDAAVLSTRIFVGDGKESIFVYDMAAMTQLGTTTVPPTGYFNGAFSVAQGAAWMGRHAGATSDEQIVAMDPATGIIRAGFPRAIPSTCPLALVGAAGLYCGDGTSLRLIALQDFTTVLRTFPGTGRLKVDVNPEGPILVALAKTVHQADAQLSEVGSPITLAIEPNELASSVSLNRIAVAEFRFLDIYNLTTHTHIGSTRDFGTDSITGITFNKTGLVVVLHSGKVTSITVDDATSDIVPPVVRGAASMKFIAFDPTRNRIMTADDANLIVLDGTTLAPIAGSPLAIPKPPLSIRVF